MENIILGAILLIIFAAAIGKIIIEKRKGAKCVGCPYSDGGSCSKPH